MNDSTKAISGWIWETDADGRFTFITDSIERIVGTPPDSYYGKTRFDRNALGFAQFARLGVGIKFLIDRAVFTVTDFKLVQ